MLNIIFFDMFDENSLTSPAFSSTDNSEFIWGLGQVVLFKLFYYTTYKSCLLTHLSPQFWIYMGSWSSCFIIRLTSPQFWIYLGSWSSCFIIHLQVLLSNTSTDNSGFICDLIILSYDYGCQAAFSAQDEGNRSHYTQDFNNLYIYIYIFILCFNEEKKKSLLVYYFKTQLLV